MSLIKKTSGFTLIETMIALVINAVLLAALLYAFSATINDFSLVIKNDRLSQQLQSAINIMVNDIRRAGYWSNVSSDIGNTSNNNPFMTTATDVTIGSSNQCILFTYDHAANGVLPSIGTSDDDRYGYRLINQTLQSRPPGATFSCTAAASAWENMTDPNLITVTALNFALTSVTIPIGTTKHNLLLRSITITLSAQLNSNSTLTKTLTEEVRIRNDKYVLP